VNDKADSAVTIFTDGACSHNPGPGAWATLLIKHDTARFIVGYESHTTNNRMELSAALGGLKALHRSTVANIHTDSKYLQQGITSWIHAWERNNWKTAAKKPVINQDLWKALSEQAARHHHVHWIWVKAHSDSRLSVDSRLNNFVDLLARTAISMSMGFDVKLKLRELEEVVDGKQPLSQAINKYQQPRT
jgi:ribonuclease HI